MPPLSIRSYRCWPLQLVLRQEYERREREKEDRVLHTHTYTYTHTRARRVQVHQVIQKEVHCQGIDAAQGSGGSSSRSRPPVSSLRRAKSLRNPVMRITSLWSLVRASVFFRLPPSSLCLAYYCGRLAYPLFFFTFFTLTFPTEHNTSGLLLYQTPVE
jgi:hypothetical protein